MTREHKAVGSIIGVIAAIAVIASVIHHWGNRTEIKVVAPTAMEKK